MPAIARDSLMTLEAYARERKTFRARVLAHKRDRTIHLGEHLTLLFEDELTIRYQIQEMLRIEKTFEEAGIQEELDAYNPLVPDGSNLKATMLLEYEDIDARRAALCSTGEESLGGGEGERRVRHGSESVLALERRDAHQRHLDRLRHPHLDPVAEVEAAVLGGTAVDDDLVVGARRPAFRQLVGAQVGVVDPVGADGRRSVPTQQVAVGTDDHGRSLDARRGVGHPVDAPHGVEHTGVDRPAVLRGLGRHVGGVAHDDIVTESLVDRIAAIDAAAMSYNNETLP